VISSSFFSATATLATASIPDTAVSTTCGTIVDTKTRAASFSRSVMVDVLITYSRLPWSMVRRSADVSMSSEWRWVANLITAGTGFFQSMLSNRPVAGATGGGSAATGAGIDAVSDIYCVRGRFM